MTLYIFQPRGCHVHDAGTGRTDGSCVLKKAHDSWIWIALCRQTRQVVASAVGDRSKKTCQRLWEAIPDSYRAGHCYTDFWAAYQAVIPKEQHTAVGSRDRRNRSCGAVEEHPAAASGSFCGHDVVVFPRLRSCTRPVFCSFSIATISTGLSFSHEPLPAVPMDKQDFRCFNVVSCCIPLPKRHVAHRRA